MLTARNTDLNDKLYFPPVQTRAKRLGFFIRKDEKNKRTYKAPGRKDRLYVHGRE